MKVGPGGLLAVQSLAILLAHLLGNALEPMSGALEFGLSVSPSLLGAGPDVVRHHLLCLGEGLCGLGASIRVPGHFSANAKG